MTTQRTETDILTELHAAKEAYAKVASDGNSTQAKVAESAATVKALSKELGEYLVQGADTCKCGNAPMGMLKTPGYYDPGKGVDVPAVWEVGCTFCPVSLVEREDGHLLMVEGEKKKVKRRSFSARALTPAEAVRKWNEGEWLEDYKFDWIPGFKPEYVTE